MFTGIIEALGKVKDIRMEAQNIHFTIKSSISSELKVDQSVAHNGVCLTVVEVNDRSHTVTAIKETLDRSALGQLKTGHPVNLERSVRSDSLMDGHIVQGHVDATGICEEITEAAGSWFYRISFPKEFAHLLVSKGSVSINGVSLTVADLSETGLTVAIIPYTFEHTNFKILKPGDKVNLEFDIIGKYLARYMEVHRGEQ